MAWDSDDLAAALAVSAPYDFNADLANAQPWDFPSDWAIDSVAGLVEDTSGPYDRGEQVRVEMAFSGAGPEHSQLAGDSSHYALSGSGGGEVTPVDAAPAPVLRFEVSSSAPDGTYTIGATYDEVFNGNAGKSGVGTQQTITITVEGFSVTLSASPASSTSINLDYEIVSGSPDYAVEIFRKESTQGPASYVSIYTASETSAGQYSTTDSGLDNTKTYDYRCDVTESGGTGRTVDDTDSASLIGFS
jgi:hypothetical protein